MCLDFGHFLRYHRLQGNSSTLSPAHKIKLFSNRIGLYRVEARGRGGGRKGGRMERLRRQSTGPDGGSIAGCS